VNICGYVSGVDAFGCEAGQLRGVAVRSLATSSSNTFIRDKSYVNGKWVSACSGKIFDGENVSLHIYVM